MAAAAAAAAAATADADAVVCVDADDPLEAGKFVFGDVGALGCLLLL